jgi:antitoxin PrlF
MISRTFDLGTAMNHVLAIESTLTDRYQTTIPETVRRILHLDKRDKLHYKIMSDGTVLLSRAESAEESDPALAGFLHFLATDVRARPHAVRALGEEQRARARALVGELKVDLDAKLDPADE